MGPEYCTPRCNDYDSIYRSPYLGQITDVLAAVLVEARLRLRGLGIAHDLGVGRLGPLVHLGEPGGILLVVHLRDRRLNPPPHATTQGRSRVSECSDGEVLRGGNVSYVPDCPGAVAHAC